MAEQRKQRSAQQKLEIVIAGMRGDRSVRDVCREHDVSEAALNYSWRDKILEGGKVALACSMHIGSWISIRSADGIPVEGEAPGEPSE